MIKMTHTLFSTSPDLNAEHLGVGSRPGPNAVDGRSGTPSSPA